MTTPRPSALKLALTGLYIAVFPGLLLLLSGDWLWPEGWAFGLWFLGLCFCTIAYLYRRDPALLAERYRKPGEAGQRGWDRWVVYGLMLGFVAWIVVMPLDGQRFGWSPCLPLWLKALGAVALMLCSFLMFRAYTDNTFLSALVRVQADRRHTVVSTGVYGFVRHPMYLGGILLFLGAPLLLGSLWGLGLGLAMTLLLASRIVGEEKVLADELEGYEEYRRKVRYRLVPLVW